MSISIKGSAMTDTNTFTSISPLTAEAIKQGRHYLVATVGLGASGAGTGTGGWGSILQLKAGDDVLRQRPFAGQEVAIATKPRMELLSPLAAFAAVRERETPVLVQSDSQLLIKGMNEWRHGWETKSWRNGDGKPVKNVDRWVALIAALGDRPIIWEWVPGHCGHKLLELAAALARDARAGKYVDDNGRVTRFKTGIVI